MVKGFQVKKKIVTLSDLLKPSTNQRSEKQQMQAAWLQLQDEAINSGIISVEKDWDSNGLLIEVKALKR
jgi:hypothetical protein